MGNCKSHSTTVRTSGIKKVLLRTVSALLISSIALTGLNVLASVGPQLPEISVEQASLSNIGQISMGEEYFSFTGEISNKAVNLQISFPTEGGIRFCDVNAKGYYNPERLKSITYLQEEENTVTLTSETGDRCVFDYGKSPWDFSVYANGSEVFKLTAEDFYANYSENERISTGISFKVQANEKFTGLGERFSGVKLNGKSYPLWNRDCWSEGEESYVNVPLLHSSNSYSIFYNSFFGGTADVTATENDKVSLKFLGSDLDFYIYSGTPIENLKNYLSLTGRTVAVPQWALGYWAGQSATYWNADGNYYGAFENVLEQYDAMGTMPSAIYGEGSPSRNSDTNRLAKNYNVKMLGWTHCDALFDGSIYTYGDIQSFFPLLNANEYPILFKKSLPSSFSNGIYSGMSNVCLDYTNSKINSLINTKMRNYWNYGVAGTMVDYGEYVVSDSLAANGMTGDELHNFNAVAYNKALNSGWSTRRGNDFILFARAGSAGSQHYAAQFAGDQQSTFDGLKRAVNGGISASLSGFGIWGSDIGGLSGNLSPELYQRWLGFSAFSPLMRAHGTGDRNPWTFGNNAVNTFKKYYYLRKNLANTLYSAMLKSSCDGTPIMQHLSLVYPDNNAYYDINDQYIYCDNILTAPVTDADVTARNVTFPEGKWYDLYNGTLASNGNENKSVSAPIDTVPAYIRSGAVINVSLNSESFNLCDNTENTTDVLLTTPAVSTTVNTHYGDEGVTTYVSTPTQNGYKITADGGEMRTLVAYSTDVNSVKVDGIELSTASAIPQSGEDAFFTCDGKTYISLSKDWNEIEFLTKGNTAEIPLWNYSFGVEKQQSDISFLDASFTAYSFDDISVSNVSSANSLPSETYTCNAGCLGKGYLLPKQSAVGDVIGKKYSALTYTERSFKDFYAEYDCYIGNTVSGIAFGEEKGIFPFTRDKNSENDKGAVVYIESNNGGVVNLGGGINTSSFVQTTGVADMPVTQSNLSNTASVRYWYMKGVNEAYNALSKQSASLAYTVVDDNVEYYTVCVKVFDNILTVWLKGSENVTYSVSLPNYNGGYISLVNSGGNTQGAIRGFRVKSLNSNITLEREKIGENYLAVSVFTDNEGDLNGILSYDTDKYILRKTLVMPNVHFNSQTVTENGSISFNFNMKSVGKLLTFVFENSDNSNDGFGISATVTCEQGQNNVNICNALCGDVNGDQVTDLKDIVRLKKYCALADVEIVFENADFSHNGKSSDSENLATLKKRILGIPSIIFNG